MLDFDINCDLGEGIGNDADIMPYISSCNIACGGHHGDESTIQKTCALAQKNNVKIGAHPSFPDKQDFGRKIINISNTDLFDSLCEQITLFKQSSQKTNMPMHHVKLHGALYNLTAKEINSAQIVIDVLLKICPNVRLYAPYQSILSDMAINHKIAVSYEAFADRRYHDNSQLVSRNREDAVITDPKDAWQQIFNVITNGKMTTVEGNEINIRAETFCVHGDQANALALVRYIDQKRRLP